MPVQVNPLDRLQAGVMQQAFQMLPHTCATLLGGECERGILIQHVQVLRAYWPQSTKYLHRLAYGVCAAEEGPGAFTRCPDDCFWQRREACAPACVDL